MCNYVAYNRFYKLRFFYIYSKHYCHVYISQCLGTYKTALAKIIVFDHMMFQSPDVPLQDELLTRIPIENRLTLIFAIQV